MLDHFHLEYTLIVVYNPRSWVILHALKNFKISSITPNLVNKKDTL